ncbi:MAG: relaxase/mobilization nuclease domain-containing protein [Lacrimispora sp.]|uniref:relaxase/mobilization nuclease domain-containing protein n=1 Tax=Lacrimispora sp. TaxID=2719234 RepID=UPI0039E3BD75
MFFIKRVNEANHIKYDTEEDIENCIAYIFNICKTMEDQKRPGHMIGDFVGCSHFFGIHSQELDANCVATQMIANNRAYGKSKNNLLMHRVIVFSADEDVMPNEAFQLAQYIANLYGEEYITAFGIHLDTDKIHIHLAINAISWRDGKRFSKSYEFNWLYGIVERWDNQRNEIMMQNPKDIARHSWYFGRE